MLEVIRRTMAALPEDRFGSIEELAAELSKVAALVDRPRSWGWIAVVGLMAVATVMMSLAVWFSPPSGMVPVGGELWHLRRRLPLVGIPLVDYQDLQIGSE